MPLISLTAMIETAEITSRLKEPEPTIACGPSSLGISPRAPIVSATERIISGADEPRAMSVRLAIVGFHTIFSTSIRFPSESEILTMEDLEVMTSMASMKISDKIVIPTKSQTRKHMYKKPRAPSPMSDNPRW